MSKEFTIALDLEGTLVSNAISQIPRKHLKEFLEFCHRNFKRVVLFTAADVKYARSVVELLAQEGHAPKWFARIKIYHPSGTYKHLNKIGDPSKIFLVDDCEHYIVPEQHDQWIKVEPFSSPYTEDDALLQVMLECSKRTGAKFL